jgi:hypothetical protein
LLHYLGKLRQYPCFATPQIGYSHQHAQGAPRLTVIDALALLATAYLYLSSMYASLEAQAHRGCGLGSTGGGAIVLAN